MARERAAHPEARPDAEAAAEPRHRVRRRWFVLAAVLVAGGGVLGFLALRQLWARRLLNGIAVCGVALGVLVLI